MRDKEPCQYLLPELYQQDRDLSGFAFALSDLQNPGYLLQDYMNMAILQVLAQLQNFKLERSAHESEGDGRSIPQGYASRRELLRFFHIDQHEELCLRIAQLERAQLLNYERRAGIPAQSPFPWEEAGSSDCGFRLTRNTEIFIGELSGEDYLK